MSDLRTVSVLTPHAYITIDYRTGHTELRPMMRGSMPPPDGSVVRHDGSVSSWGTLEVPAVLPGAAPVPLRWRLGAVPAVLVTASVGLAGPRRGRFSRLVRLARVGRSLRPAQDAQAKHAVRAVRWASLLIPARWACLEQSAAAAVLLAAAGLRAEWRHGIATDPVRLHAWIADLDGQPVEEPADTNLYTPTYTPDGPALTNTRGAKGTTP